MKERETPELKVLLPSFSKCTKVYYKSLSCGSVAQSVERPSKIPVGVALLNWFESGRGIKWLAKILATLSVALLASINTEIRALFGNKQ